MRKRRWWILCAAILVAAGCQIVPFPTTDDMDRATEADHNFVSGEHEGIVDAFTKQHALQNPELSPELQAVVEEYKLAVVELRALADEVKAEGFDIMGTEGMAMLLAAFPGVGLWLRETRKPSRSAGQVAQLEAHASVRKDEIAELRLALATASKPGAAMPSDS